jgi:hypothetical protein
MADTFALMNNGLHYGMSDQPTEDSSMADTFALMNNGLHYGMSDQQERDARRHQARTVPYEDRTWGWSADIGEAYGFASEEEAWDGVLTAIEDWENEA